MTKPSHSDINKLFRKVIELDDADKSEIVARVFGIMEACHMRQVGYHPHDFFELLKRFIEKDQKNRPLIGAI